eukprot:CAMPEP_0198333140 /NCGR_PEP_ID=MMETSP1450-20131203/18758_1 /TAXON_ID=753684 ORGANISM="Madagascaria erythrocladiodes, Strain CCMP3234" /NCGR_SAMPLE_ID=MMETSP1450 /ASSEMBLY_ACC=CAM_ASM_001115 /LENGTH=357 /DNA_ID=CAMNT_0044037645 /DNA_START=55 /DNA_END=1124 /DNA_ORIENTATION=-
MAAVTKMLANALGKMKNEPTEGFTAELESDDDLRNWLVYIEGAKGTMYEGGVFKLRMTFPETYPMEPPKLVFLSEFWHPNVYTDGTVCMSILHKPGNDPMSGERPEERWLPTQTVNTVLLSLISMLDEPNFSSPANVDASVQLRKDKEAYRKKVRSLIKKAKEDIPAHIKIPHPDTDPEERARAVEKIKLLTEPSDIDFGFDEDDFDENDFDDDGDGGDWDDDQEDYGDDDGDGGGGDDDFGDDDDYVARAACAAAVTSVICTIRAAANGPYRATNLMGVGAALLVQDAEAAAAAPNDVARLHVVLGGAVAAHVRHHLLVVLHVHSGRESATHAAEVAAERAHAACARAAAAEAAAA